METAFGILLFLIIACLAALMLNIISLDDKLSKLIRRFDRFEIDMMEREIKEEEYKWAPKEDEEVMEECQNILDDIK